MNTQRVIVLGLALVAAIGAALMVHAMLGGGAKSGVHSAPAVTMSEVLVASTNLEPGQMLEASQVRWDKWPASAAGSGFILHNGGTLDDAVKGQVVRTPILAGQPIANDAIVKSDAAGFMAATLSPGMRAVSITINADQGAGGFILPNDRVDVIMTRKFDETRPPLVVSDTILSNLRVLAVDQTYKQEKDTKTVTAKSATLEVSPAQAEVLTRSTMAGSLSLALRPLGDGAPVASLTDKLKKYMEKGGPVKVIRYGMSGNRTLQNAEMPQ